MVRQSSSRDASAIFLKKSSLRVNLTMSSRSSGVRCCTKKNKFLKKYVCAELRCLNQHG